MPATGAVFSDRADLLTFEELERLTTLLVERLGITEVRLTGGEPLVRRDLDQLVRRIAKIPDLQDLSLTTNGVLLADQAKALRQAGLQRVNISLDTLDREVFQRIARRDGLEQTIAGIDAAIAAGFESIKLNALAIKGITENELVRLVRFAADRHVPIRFIEFMPLDSDQQWRSSDVLSGDQMLAILSQEFGSIQPIGRERASKPAEEFQVGNIQVGIIRSVTQPFCQSCDRLRITADGAIRNCLFAKNETPLRVLMREGASDDQIVNEIQQCLMEKQAAHGIDDPSFRPPQRKMYSIGG